MITDGERLMRRGGGAPPRSKGTPAAWRPSQSLRSSRQGAGPVVRLLLLRGFELTCDGRSIPLVMSAQRLLAFLALHDRSLPRAYVAETLWLDTPGARAAACLRSTLWRAGIPGLDLIEAGADHLRLDRDVGVDVREVGALIRRLEQLDEPLADIDLSALRGGDLLPGWYDDWVLIERERYRQLGLHGLEMLCCRLARQGRFAAAVEAGLAAVEGEPLRESAHRALIQVHLSEGNAGEAIRQYRIYSELVRRELGLEPSGLMTELIRGLTVG